MVKIDNVQHALANVIKRIKRYLTFAIDHIRLLRAPRFVITLMYVTFVNYVNVIIYYILKIY